MSILISSHYPLLASIAITFALIFLAYLFLFKEQDARTNWAIFYSTLYVGTTLPILNYLCVKFDLWQFIGDSPNWIKLPYDLYFLWIVLWSILPVYFLKGRYLWLIALVLFWVDILFMPLLVDIGILSLSRNWWIGEVVLVGVVFIPGYFWAACSYQNIRTGIRAIFQVVVMTCLFIIYLPFLLESYGLIDFHEFRFAPYSFQLFLIIVFPSLIAVFDLVKKGEGTPFPYDPTKHLIKTGVYAYCRNPIQWSFTFMFIPLAIYYASYYLLIGSVISIAYSFGVSDYQEYADMKARYGKDWEEYKMNVPKWRFLWTPTRIPKGVIYFDANCSQCSQISNWFSKSNAINLDIKAAADFPADKILQATYIDHNGVEFKSVYAIACCLEHINLAYASLAWFMRFPIINYLLQLIVDTMEFGTNKDSCGLR